MIFFRNYIFVQKTIPKSLIQNVINLKPKEEKELRKVDKIVEPLLPQTTAQLKFTLKFLNKDLNKADIKPNGF